MSTRLQVVLNEAELNKYRRLAAREGLTLSEWVRQKLRRSGRDETPGNETPGNIERKLATIRAAARHNFPTADLDRMVKAESPPHGPD